MACSISHLVIEYTIWEVHKPVCTKFRILDHSCIAIFYHKVPYILLFTQYRQDAYLKEASLRRFSPNCSAAKHQSCPGRSRGMSNTMIWWENADLTLSATQHPQETETTVTTDATSGAISAPGTTTTTTQHPNTRADTTTVFTAQATAQRPAAPSFEMPNMDWLTAPPPTSNLSRKATQGRRVVSGRVALPPPSSLLYHRKLVIQSRSAKRLIRRRQSPSDRMAWT
jgi:hypothetical protein